MVTRLTRALALAMILVGCGKQPATQQQKAYVFPHGNATTVFVAVLRIDNKFVLSEDTSIAVPAGTYHAVSCTFAPPVKDTFWYFSVNVSAKKKTPAACENSLNFRYDITIGGKGVPVHEPPACHKVVSQFEFGKPLGDIMFGPDWLPVKPLTMEGTPLPYGRYLYQNTFDREIHNDGLYFITPFPDPEHCMWKLDGKGDTAVGQGFVYEGRGLHLTGTGDLLYYKEVTPGTWEFCPEGTRRKQCSPH